MTQAEVLRRAKREIEQRRQQAERQAKEKKDHLYKEIPELNALDEQAAQLGAFAATLAINGKKEESQQKLEDLKQVKKEKQTLLIKNGYKKDDLEPDYFCKLCKDTGYFDGKTCVCVQKIENSIRREDVSKASMLNLCQFENFSLDYYPAKINNGNNEVSARERMAQVLQDCKEYAEYFGPRSPDLFMHGSAGLGKSHLALSIASQLLNKGLNVVYVSSQAAFSAVSSERYTGDTTFKTMIKADLLVLDDLGSEYIDAYILSKLYELINGRMYHRPTIYTTNISDQTILYQRYTEKIASRLLGDCHPMPFLGKDIRIRKNRI